jgi:cytochrome c556
MQLMDQIRETMAALETMATGDAPFNATLAERLARKLAADAAAIPVHFEFQFDDPHSAARPDIWSDWPGFAEAAAQTETLAARVPTGSVATLRRGLEAVRQSCDACHDRYRVGE